MSWWLWAIVAWFVVSVPFAVLTAKFIAVGREGGDAERAESAAEDDPVVVDLPTAEAAEAAIHRRTRARHDHPASGTGSEPARSG